jgi:hypothetical protein
MTINNSNLNSTWTISLNTLYNSIENTNQIINENTKKTFFGFLIHHSIRKDINNYELLDPHTGEILCMDGESCIIVSTHIDSYTLFCINDESHTPFQLMRNELFIATFDECHNWAKDPDDMKLYYDYQKRQLVTHFYMKEKYKTELNDDKLLNKDTPSFQDWLNNLLHGDRYEEVCIPKNASLACSTCKYHSANGCTNDVRLAYDYYSASDDEKEYILNGEYCKYYCEINK